MGGGVKHDVAIEILRQNAHIKSVQRKELEAMNAPDIDLRRDELRRQFDSLIQTIAHLDWENEHESNR